MTFTCDICKKSIFCDGIFLRGMKIIHECEINKWTLQNPNKPFIIYSIENKEKEK